jgi:Fe-S-cluster containining protein
MFDKIDSSCMKIIEFCRAICCRQGGFLLTQDEISSAKYETEIYCLKNKSICDKPVDCYYKIVQIRMAGGACVYLGTDNLCTIHDSRPQVCRMFECRVSRGLFGSESERRSEISEYADRLLLRFSGGVVFAPNPLVALKTLIVDNEKGKLFLLVRDRELCEDTMYSSEIGWPGANEETLFEMFHMFDGKRDLGEIESVAAERFGNVDMVEFAKKVRRFLSLCERLRLLIPVHCC